MKLINDLSAAACLDRVRGVLEQDEASNTLLLGLLTRLSKEEDELEGQDRPFFAFVEEDNSIPLVMLMTPPHNLILYGAGNHLAAAIDVTVSALSKKGVALPGVIGPREVAMAFASAWQRRTRCTFAVGMEQMIYRLDRVNEIDLSPGELIQAVQTHVDLIADWIVGFSQVTLDPIGQTEAREQAERRLAAGSLYLWYDERPVSMAWRARPITHGITVSGVYTPPAFRNRGYATACVASLSQLLLDEGYAFCALYADLSNPTSNSIYQKIGYRPIQPSIVLRFGPSNEEET